MRSRRPAWTLLSVAQRRAGLIGEITDQEARELLRQRLIGVLVALPGAGQGAAETMLSLERIKHQDWRCKCVVHDDLDGHDYPREMPSWWMRCPDCGAKAPLGLRIAIARADRKHWRTPWLTCLARIIGR